MKTENMRQHYVRRIAVIALLLFTAIASAKPGAASKTNPETTAARQAVEAYFRAADSGNADAVRNVFHPDGRVEGMLGGKFVSWTADEFADRNFKGKPPAYASTIRRKIEWLDRSGSSAIVRVTIETGPDNRYTDYFVLLKIEGRWKISRKVFANE
jgi:ketosteroid isomerase-like protein